jgi:hypothetical protein
MIETNSYNIYLPSLCRAAKWYGSYMRLYVHSKPGPAHCSSPPIYMVKPTIAACIFPRKLGHPQVSSPGSRTCCTLLLTLHLYLRCRGDDGINFALLYSTLLRD